MRSPGAGHSGRPLAPEPRPEYTEMMQDYSEMRVRSHVVGIERLERQRWRVSVDGRRLFTFCTEARARDAGRLEARRLDFVADDRGRLRGPPAVR